MVLVKDQLLLLHMMRPNDGRNQGWSKKGDAFLRPKGREKGITVSDFLLPWKCLNPFHLQLHEREALIASAILEKVAKTTVIGMGQ